MNHKIVQGLKNLLKNATAPYDEMEVRDMLFTWLNKLDLPHEIDSNGNTLVRVKRGQPRRQIAFIAHLDHPAFRVTSVKGHRITAKAQGGLPWQGIRGAKVVFPKSTSNPIYGKIESSQAITVKGRTRLKHAQIKLPAKSEIPAIGDFAIFDIPSFNRIQHRLQLRVADDLAGVVAIVLALSELSRTNAIVDVLGVFTRAEEVGFHGALALALEGRINRHTTMISVECSQAYGDIKLGSGPVVRLGDRAGPFDPRACALLTGAAQSIKQNRFKYQSALMSGGTCEATAFGVFGYPVSGIALPLGAYHNQGKKGAVPEEIDIRDLSGAIQLIQAASIRAGAGIEDLEIMRNDFITSSQAGRDYLREPINPITGYPKNTKF